MAKSLMCYWLEFSQTNPRNVEETLPEIEPPSEIPAVPPKHKASLQ